MKLPGTNSTAIQNPDGTWDVFDVPIVSDGVIPRFNAKGEKVDEWSTDEEWFEFVLRAHNQRRDEGYLGRGFIDHHADDGSQPDSGFIVPTRVGEVTIRGEAVKALFADIVNVPDEVYRGYVKAGRVPYRSIESLRAESGWIDGLALMPTRPPHYHLPMLTIGREVPFQPDASGSETVGASPEVAVACASKHHALRIFAESTMPENDTKPEGAENQGDEKGGGGESKGSGWKAKLEALMNEAVKAEEIPDFLSAIGEIADKLGANGEGGAGGEEPPPPEAPVAEQEEPEEEPMNASSKERDARIRAEAQAEVERANAATAREELGRRKAIEDAEKELARFHPALRDPATLKAKLDRDGVRGLGIYVETVKASATPSPNPGEQDAPIGQDDAVDLPEPVARITNPDHRAVAIKAHARWQSMKDDGFDMADIPLEGMIRRDLRKAGFED